MLGEEEHDRERAGLGCPVITGSATRLHLSQVQDRPADIKEGNKKRLLEKEENKSVDTFSLHHKHYRRASHYVHMQAFLYK